jgi:ribosome-binding protein aMBF1 (putative translation factor)
MDEAKRKRLEAAGWTMGDYGDFLGLTDAERQHVELRGDLRRAVRRLREAKGLTQRALGKMIGSTQSRVAKVETGTGEVSLDLMFRAFFALGGKLEDLTDPKPSAKPEVMAERPKAKRLARQGG